MPWRKTKDAYAIWLSEVMLQQTRVDTVIPYYEKFLDVFPTIESLAHSNENQLMKMWEGLGYYRRARHMRECAIVLLNHFEASLPKRSSELIKLKGFGPYTSASVASIAFGEPIACIDGNVRRVVSRLYASHEDIDERARALVYSEDSSSFNQGMMELGAMVCTPVNPKCGVCPVQTSCQAFFRNEVAVYPLKKAKPAPTEISAVCFSIKNRSARLYRQRSANEKWAGMWEQPFFEFEKNKTSVAAEAIQKLEIEFGISVLQYKESGRFVHILTHRKIHVLLLEVLEWNGTIKNAEFLSAEEVQSKPLSRLQQKALANDRKEQPSLF